MKACMGSRGTAPLTHNLGAIWRLMVNFMSRPLYNPWIKPRYSLRRQLTGPQSLYGWFWRRENFPPAGIQKPNRPTLSLVIIPTGRVSLFHGSATHNRPGPHHYRGFTIISRHTTLGRTPLDEGSARRTDFYLTTHRQPWPNGIRTRNPSKRTAADTHLPTEIGRHSNWLFYSTLFIDWSLYSGRPVFTLRKIISIHLLLKSPVWKVCRYSFTLYEQ